MSDASSAVTLNKAARLQEAAAHLQSGDPARALAIVEQVLGADPRDVEALHMFALSLSRLGDIDRAAQAYEEAAAFHPRKEIVLANLGHHLKRAGRLEAAASAYERAAFAAPGSAEPLAALGAVRATLGDRAGAADAFERALTLDPRNSAAFNGLGNIAAARGKQTEAADYFASAIAAAPHAPTAYINRGAALRHAGRFDESLADLDRAATLAPSSPEAVFQRAATLRTMGRPDEAVAGYKKALAGAPDRADIHRELTGMLFEAGRVGEAFHVLDAVIASKPSPDLNVLRGELSLLFGDIAAAADAAPPALSMAPEDARAHGLEAQLARNAGAMDQALASARHSVKLAPDNFALLHICSEIELATGNAAAAAQRLQGCAPRAHLQKHIALRATAMRVAGNPGYRRYYDYDRLTAQIAIDPPPGFATIAEFNAALFRAIEPLHRTKQRPLDQTLFGGTQSQGRLWNEQHPVIRRFSETMLAAARAFVMRLPDDPSHPFLAQKSIDLECSGAWSVLLASGGGHVDHIHPAGWVSASYYVQSPPEIFEGGRAGHLRLGASGVPGLELQAERYFPPEPGTVVFFPSYVWHGVEPFVAASPRATAPFDLSPVAR